MKTIKSSIVLMITGLLIQLISLFFIANIIFKSPAEGSSAIEILLETNMKIMESMIYFISYCTGCLLFFIGLADRLLEVEK